MARARYTSLDDVLKSDEGKLGVSKLEVSWSEVVLAALLRC